LFDDILPFTDPDKVHPFVYEDEGTLALHFDISAIQSRMRRDDPYRLDLDYTRAMMGFLLLEPAPRSILVIGLGGGSLPKYCWRYLPDADITVVEVNPHVIAMRETFLVPPDGSRFRVVCDDGARFAARARRQYDVVLVDGFTYDGQPEQLCTQAFYDTCRSVLTDTGVLVANLHGEAPMCDLLCDRIALSFGDDAVQVVPVDRGANLVVLAGKASALNRARSAFDERWHALDEVHRQTLSASAAHFAQTRGPQAAGGEVRTAAP
jgi:spermidine synthase